MHPAGAVSCRAECVRIEKAGEAQSRGLAQYTGDVAQEMWRGGCGAGDVARGMWRAGGGAGDVAREMWRGGCGAGDVAWEMWRGRSGAGDVAREMWRGGCGAAGARGVACVVAEARLH